MTNKKNLRLNGILSTIEFHFIYGEYNEFSLQYIYNIKNINFWHFMSIYDFYWLFYFHDTNIRIYTNLSTHQYKKDSNFLRFHKIIGKLSL